MNFKSIAAGVVLAVTSVSAASAATFEWNYTSVSGQELVGFFEAEELTPGTLTLSSVFDVTVNGNAAPALPFLFSLDDSLFAPAPSGIATIAADGSAFDVLACVDAICTDGFLVGQIGFETGFASGFAFGGVFDETLNDGGFTVVPSVVPLPASAFLLLAGLGGIAAGRRRKAA